MARTPDEPDIVPPPIITLLTDFGAADVFVGSMKGVILGINPHAKIIDLTHDIPAHNIRAGAYLLHSASIRRTALVQNVPYQTTMAGARATMMAIEAGLKRKLTVKPLQEYYAVRTKA